MRFFSIFVIAVLVVVTIPFPLLCQSSPSVLDEVVRKLRSVQSYEADVTLDIDIEFVNAPQSSGKIYYKQPGKVQLVTKGFSLFPKNGLSMTPLSLLLDHRYTSVPTGTAIVAGIECSVLKIIPLDNSDSNPVVLATLYIDEDRSVVVKNETTTKKNGTFTMVMAYGKEVRRGLPDKLSITFDTPDFKLPRSMTGDLTNKGQQDAKRRTNGSVSVTFTNYRINKNISDAIFK